MDKYPTGPRIRAACARKFPGMGPREISKVLKLGESAFKHHYNGIRGLKPDVAQNYAELLGVSVKWLLYGETEATRIPIIESVAAGGFTDTTDPYPVGSEEAPAIEFPGLPHNRFIALRVEGSSMNKVAPEGSLIVVDLTVKTATPGRYYVFRLDHDAATFKRFEDNPPRYEPESTEKHSSIVPQSGTVEVVGRVTKVLTDL